jgi:predicted ATPase
VERIAAPTRYATGNGDRFRRHGKTRTALQLATLCLENLSTDFPQGVWWVELEEARSGDAMISRIAASLRFQLQPQPSAREQLWSFLGERQALLVLDNLEQIPDAAVIVNEMLQGGAAPQMRGDFAARAEPPDRAAS